tara:strand:- start:71 stop:433 length:363 start_codon:yes stop_codon:yes gene_type:complete
MPTYHKIEISMDTVNVSLQVGDVAYKLDSTTTQQGGINYSNSSGEPIVKLGTITKIEQNAIYIIDMQSTVNSGDVIMYCKDVGVNKSGVKGYYSEVTLTNNSANPIELFAISSEITPSSK